MKTTTIPLKKIIPKVDDHGKRLKDNDLRMGTWNVRTCNVGWTSLSYRMGLGCKALAICDMYYSYHVNKH